MTVIKMLLELASAQDLVLDLRNEAGEAALHLAVSSGDILVMELLLRAGADTTIRDNRGLTPLECASLELTVAQRKVIQGLFKKFKAKG